MHGPARRPAAAAGDAAPITAIVLAAGFSSRMGRFKPLLALGGRPVIERVVTGFRDGGVEDVRVVVGHRGEEIRRVLAPLQVPCVDNPAHAAGMFSSVLAGMRALPRDCGAFFIHPADIALLRAQTVRRLAASFQASPAAVLYPVFDGRRGHPPLIDGGLAPRLLAWSGDGGLRPFLEQFDARSRDLAVADEAILMDLDTPDDLHRLQERVRRTDLPSDAECRVLMTGIQSLPDAIVAHCRAVAAVARCLAAALADAGLPIDVERVRTAALLHDVARTEADHARAGARLLERHGFPHLAPLVATHMELDVDPEAPVDDAGVVYLADKLVGGDRVVDLERRFARKLDTYGHEPAARGAVLRRREASRRIRSKLERATGRSLEQLLPGIGEPDGGGRRS